MLKVLRVVAGVLASLLLGVLVGLLGSFQHQSDWTVGGQRIAIGMFAGIAALVLAQFVARDAVPFGIGPGLVLLAWVVVVAVFGTSRPEGDLVVPAGLEGQGFLYGGFLLGIVVAATLAISGASGAARARR